TSLQTISATAGDGKVHINLPVRNALVKYDIYRSYFPDGGFVKINQQPALDPTYVDGTVSNGTRYYYYFVGEYQSGVVVAAPGAPLSNARINIPTPSDMGPNGGIALSAHGVEVQAFVDTASKNPQHLIALAALAQSGTNVKPIADWQPLL